MRMPTPNQDEIVWIVHARASFCAGAAPLKSALDRFIPIRSCLFLENSVLRKLILVRGCEFKRKSGLPSYGR